MTMTTYRVEFIGRDAARPYGVVFTGRTYNTVVGTYATKEAATRRVRYLDALGRRIETYRLPTPVPVLCEAFDE